MAKKHYEEYARLGENNFGPVWWDGLMGDDSMLDALILDNNMANAAKT